MKVEMYEVVEKIDGAHQVHTTYPLLPGDLLFKNNDGTYTKEAPGLCISGFILDDDQQHSLREVDVHVNGLKYYRVEDV